MLRKHLHGRHRCGGPSGPWRLRSGESIQGKRLVRDEKENAKGKVSGFIRLKGRKRRGNRGPRDVEGTVTSFKEGTHFKNKKVVKLSSGSGVQQDVKLDEVVGHVNQEVIGDLFKSLFTIMVSGIYLKTLDYPNIEEENGN